MLAACVQATNQQGFNIKERKKKASARRYADDSACSQGQVAEKEKVGVEEEEEAAAAAAGRVSKDQTTFTTSFSKSRTKNEAAV